MLRDTFLTLCGRFLQDIKDYDHQRKKLDNRRCGVYCPVMDASFVIMYKRSYDTAMSKPRATRKKKKKKKKRRDGRQRTSCNEVDCNLLQAHWHDNSPTLSNFEHVRSGSRAFEWSTQSSITTLAPNDSDEDDIAESISPITRHKSCSDSRSMSHSDSGASCRRSDGGATASGLSETNTTLKSNRRIKCRWVGI
ncbi:hypothetical protein J3A83DRAFT_1716761 [Scleroderma citrinum]